MAKQTRGNRKQKSAERREPKSNTATIVVLVLVGLVLIAGFWFLRSRSTSQSVTSSEAVAQAGFQQLKGRWRRTDGGYVIDIKSVDDSGRMEATYLNPALIRVSKAEASRQGAALKVAIELRDGGYAGSTYDLTYDQSSGELRGKYFQAVIKESFDVVFVKAS